MKNIVIVAAGTGGHIFPGIAVAKEFIRQNPKHKIIFIGAKNGLEKEIVKSHNFDYAEIDVRKLHRRLTFQNILFPYFLVKSYFQARRILKSFESDIFLGFGGFVSGSVGIAAKNLHIPIFLQEQNSYPGISTRFLAKSSKKIFLGNSDAKKYLKISNEKIKFSGNPIRKFKNIGKTDALKFLKLANKKTIFVYGGSQGSHFINQAFSKIVDKILQKNIQIIFQTGSKDFSSINQKFGKKNGIIIRKFFRNIEYAYRASDLVICRSGAISLAEISFFGLPAILIPFPFSAGQHQLLNSKSFSKNNAAEIMIEKNLTSKKLFEKIAKILNDNEKLNEMSKASKKMFIPNSAKIIVEEISHNFKEEN